MRKKFLHPDKNRLIYIESEPTEQFWDDKWMDTAKRTFSNPPKHRFMVNKTKKYINSGSKILEGGCGLGDIVYALHGAGFDAHGVDFAPKVVSMINRNWPNLNVSVGDVRHLQADSGYYDGYWSIGVIEHFFFGYADISAEMHRVLKVGGILFLSFPSFNRYRKHLSKKGHFLMLENSADIPKGFYQFALNPDDVIQHFQSLGFELLEFSGMSSILGLSEDSQAFTSIQNYINDNVPSLIGSIGNRLFDYLFGRHLGHSALLIFRKLR